MDQRQTEDGPRVTLTDVRVGRKRILCCGVVQNNVFPGTSNILDDRFRHSAYDHFSPTDDDRLPVGEGFRFYSLLVPSGKHQQTSLSARVLNRCAHERVDQLFQNQLARQGLRDFDNRSEIQLLDRCSDRAYGTAKWLLLCQLRIQLVELPHLTGGFPKEIAVPSVP